MLRKFKKRIIDNKGFTLLELLVVMIILGLLAALVAPKFFSHVGKSKTKAAKTQIELLGTALDTMRLDVGRYPTTEEGLNALREDPGITRWGGPYLTKSVPKDPWQRPYIYSYPGENGSEYDIVSYGSDGTQGGSGEDQDVANWKEIE
jgi:general secretion pathway protein G